MKMILIAASLVLASCSSTSFNSAENCGLNGNKECEKTSNNHRMPQAFEYMSQTRR